MLKIILRLSFDKQRIFALYYSYDKSKVKPHIVLTIAEREWFEGEGRDKSYEEIIREAIKNKK